jgi:diguanylate cyclase (GGDEF)-like protein
MPGEDRDRDKNTLYESLLKQGVSKAQIERVYRELRDKGYGEEEARRRSRAALERGKPGSARSPDEPSGSARSPGAQPQPLARDRRAETPAQPPAPALRKAPAKNAARDAASGLVSLGMERHEERPQLAWQPAKPPLEGGKRAIDWLPTVPSWLRRRINKYAYRNGFLITRLLERVEDLLSLFDANREDLISIPFMRLLAERKGYRGENPFELSFTDDLDALRDSAQTLMGLGALGSGPEQEAEGEARGDDVVRALRSREPFVLEFLGEFTRPYEMLRKSLAFLGGKLASGSRARVIDVARVVKDGCRLIAVTGAVETDRLEALFDLVRTTNLSLHPGEQTAAEQAEAEGVFRAAYQNLAKYNHELYPALLKMIASFWEERQQDPEKRERILAFLELREDQILTWEGWQRRVQEEREKALAEQRAKELERLEQEKAEKFSAVFEGTLSTLMALFPDSSIERVDQEEYILPYFVNRVFTKNVLLQSRLPDVEKLAASDVAGLIIVFHSILDDLLSSVDPYALEKVLGRETLAGELITLRGLWSEVYTRLFDPYLDEIREFAREISGEARLVKLFRESQRARGIEERINRLRNRMIKGFGHVITEPDHYEGPRLYELSSRLVEMLADVGQFINQDLLEADDPVRGRIAAELASRRVVDFAAHSQTSSPEYRPVTRQIRRWIEARHHESVLDIPQKAQVAFIDVFRGIADLYNYLLNDRRSFTVSAAHGVFVASSAEAERWSRERSARGRAPLEALQATLKEEFPGRFVDSLTGLRNKEYFLNELPRKLSKLRGQGKPLSFLMIDIDHFKWINDELGHPRGDEVLKFTGQLILDNIREGDIGIRYGGEELLVVVPSDLHTGIILAERLRHAQQQSVVDHGSLSDVRQLEIGRGEPCGTLSIGIADVTGGSDLSRAVERCDKAMYFAKRSRNTVAFLDPSKDPSLGDPYTTYSQYREKAGRVPW